MVHPCRVQVNHRLATPNTTQGVPERVTELLDNLIYQVWFEQTTVACTRHGCNRWQLLGNSTQKTDAPFTIIIKSVGFN